MDQTRRNILKTVAIVLLIIVAVLVAFVYTMTSPRVMSVKELVNNGAITFEEPRPIDDFELVDHTGEPFTHNDLEGQWTLLFFGFAHCHHFCPTTLALLDAVSDQLEDSIREQTQVVMVSVDPSRDSPEVLAEYVPKFNPGFIGVTGEFLPIKLLANQLNVPFQKPPNAGEDYQVSHGEQIVLINPRGEYQGFFKPPHTLARLKATYQSIVISHGGE
ncbi:SCO family protein [Gilvimarinus sp. F26214L]|uniref:SCO family protein n=1 Tax=Gilvimarinus sp. DZF01 TaxID=3461371 RepID=UPI0040454262